MNISLTSQAINSLKLNDLMEPVNNIVNNEPMNIDNNCKTSDFENYKYYLVLTYFRENTKDRLDKPVDLQGRGQFVNTNMFSKNFVNLFAKENYLDVQFIQAENKLVGLALLSKKANGEIETIKASKPKKKLKSLTLASPDIEPETIIIDEIEG